MIDRKLKNGSFQVKFRPPIEMYESLDREIDFLLSNAGINEELMGKNMAKKPKLGSGARFKAVEKAAAKSGASNPAAVAASVGIKKYGKKKMAKIASAGRKRRKK